MSSEEDFMFRPVLNGMYQVESLKNGNLTLLDVVKCNEALDIKFENELRLRESK